MRQKNVFVCPAQIEDVPEIHRIIQIIEENLSDKTLFIADDRKFIEKHISKEGYILTARDGENKILGFCMVRFPRLQEDNLGKHLQLDEADLMRCAHIESIGVLPEARGFSIQKMLIIQSEMRIRRERINHVFATVSPKNLISLNNFQKNGYTILETAEKYGGYIRHILHKKLLFN